MKPLNKILLFVAIFFISIAANSQQIVIYDATNLAMSPKATFRLDNGTDLVNLSEKGDLNGIIVFSGSKPQTISGKYPTRISEIKIENGASVTLKNNVNVFNALTIDKGTIVLEDKNLRIEQYVPVKGNFSKDAMIVPTGKGKLEIVLNKDGKYFFPVGDLDGTAEYTPANITLSKCKYQNAVLSLSLKNTKFDKNTSKNYLNRYWELSQTGISNLDANVEFSFVDADITGTITDDFVGAVWVGSHWVKLSKVKNNKITGISDKLGIFTAGDQKALKIENVDIDDDIVELLIDGDNIIIKSTNEFPINKIEIFNRLGQSVNTVKPANAIYCECSLTKRNDIYLFRISSTNRTITKKIFVH